MSLQDYSHLCTPGSSSSKITLDTTSPTIQRVHREHGLRQPRRQIQTAPRRPIALAITLSLSLIPAAAASPVAVAFATATGTTTPTMSMAVEADEYRTHVRVPDTWVELHQQFQPGFIVLSYLIAFVGSLCTLELLIRRTSNAGWRNQLLLSAAGICFGAVSTFSMHFVFNNALTLSHPDIQNGDPLSLMYAPGYTVLSLVASCAAMTIAFFVMSTSVAEWYCVPGSRARRAMRKETERKQGDEYRRWKSAYKGNAVRRGTTHVTSLVKQAHQRVSKWSLMEGGESKYLEESEMEFRLGSGTKQSSFNPDPEILPSAPRAVVRPATATSQHSAPSWPSTPTYTKHDQTQHSQDQLADDREQGEIFASNYNFPPRGDRDSIASLLVRESPSPSRSGRRSSIDYPAAMLPDLSRRRASLPVVLPPRDGLTHTLSRIQSLPEAEQVSPKVSPNIEKPDMMPEAPRVRVMENPKAPTKLQRFLGFDVVTLEDIWKIVLTGTIAGFGVAGMHYIGQLSIVGMPYIAYDPAYVVGSIIIASGAVVIALYIMFIMLRPKLKHGIIYKICVALILAVAVCAMHFCGMMGTTYAWPPDTPITKHDLLQGTNGAIVGVVSALAFAACLGCGVFFLIEAIQARKERQRRRRVVVASIMLDEHDRLLVNSTDGLPPMCDIASLSGNDIRSSKSTVGDASSSMIGMDLTPGHEAFISALRLSWYWKHPEFTPTLSDAPVNVSSTLQEIRRGSFQTVATSLTSVSRPTKITVTRFLERFVNSSGQLAQKLTGHQEGIQRIGVLYDQILTTGWVKLHNSKDTVSKGQLIILVRRVTSQQEREDLLTRHFIFAESSAVAAALQRTLSVPLEHMNPLLQDVKLFCDSTARVSLQPGMLYAGVAVVQATPFDGLRILLEQENRSQLPMRELCAFNANPSTANANAEELSGTVEEIGEALTWLDGMSLVSIINRNVGRPLVGGPRVTALLTALERAIVPMLDEMLNGQDMEHVIPRLQLHPVLVPLTPGTPRPDPINTYVPPYLIVLYANYDAAVNTFTDKWLPFNLFRAQNGCVMAKSIAVAAAMFPEDDSVALGQGGVASASRSAREQGWNPSRRPSKVQFEDQVEEVPFSTFTFPPRETHVAQSRAASAAAAAGPRRSSLARGGAGYGNGNGNGNGHGNGHVGLGMGMGMGDEYEREKEKVRVNRTVYPGVAPWDQEWLLSLLRAKLRTDV